MSEHEPDEARRPSLLDVVVFAPIDAAISVLRDPLGAAARGRAQAEQVVRQARALGELTVHFSLRELRARTSPVASDATPAPAPVRRKGAGPPPDEVIADYDNLSASQIVPMLSGLTESERQRVAAYESTARARQTILRKLAQLDEHGG